MKENARKLWESYLLSIEENPENSNLVCKTVIACNTLISSTLQPLDKSFQGFFTHCKIGPIACAQPKY